MFRTNFLFLSICMIATNVFAQDGGRSYYTAKPNCYVKRYHNKELEIVPDKKFQNIALIAKELTRNPQFKAFKLDGEIYLSPKDCFAESSDSVDEIGNEAINSQAREEKKLDEKVTKQKKSTSKQASNAVVLATPQKNRFFIEVGAGLSLVSSKGPIYPNYQSDLGALEGGVDVDGIRIDKVHSPAESKYKTKPLMQLGFGFRSDNYFWAFRLKRFTATKQENIQIDLTDTNTGDVFQSEAEFKFKDTITNVMGGIKYIFNDGQTVRPYVAGYLGLSLLDSTFTYLDNIFDQNEADYKLGSTSLAASAELGFDFFLSNSIAWNVTGGYEMLAHKELKVKEEGDSGGSALTDNGFKTDMSYSNIYATTGLVFYW